MSRNIYIFNKRLSYSESPEAANHYRKEILAQMESLIESKRRESDSRRERFFRPDFSSEQTYEADIHKYRQRFKEMLGWPLALPISKTAPSADEVTFPKLSDEPVYADSQWEFEQCLTRFCLNKYLEFIKNNLLPFLRVIIGE